jgi:hypothetical protein
MTYNFTDPEIRLMVKTHRPQELWRDAVGGAVSGGIACDTCHRAWPCPPIRELRAWLTEARDGHLNRVATALDPNQPWKIVEA